MSLQKILIIDDDEDIIDFISIYFKDKDFTVYSATNEVDAVNLISTVKPNVIVLDIMLLHSSGLELCKKIKAHSNTPIIFLSCLSSEDDIVRGFVSGGDDYLTKPFSLRELYYRVNALIRRSVSSESENENTSILKYPNLKIDMKNKIVSSNDTIINLTKKEFELLVILAKHPEHVFTSEELYFNIWKTSSHGDIRTVYVHISNLRKKLYLVTNLEYIENIIGIGYRFSS